MAKTRLRNLLTRTVDLLGLEIPPGRALGLVFAGPRTMTRLKQQFFGVKRLTDVICFDYRRARAEDGVQDGDVAVEIIICPDAAIDRARTRKGSTYAGEMVLYLVHGLLHAAGEDDGAPRPRAKMRRQERKIMTSLAAEFNFSEIFPK